MDGLEAEVRDARAGLFGKNIIDIEEKPILRLLIDEVIPSTNILILDPPPILHIPSIFHHPLVDG